MLPDRQLFLDVTRRRGNQFAARAMFSPGALCRESHVQQWQLHNYLGWQFLAIFRAKYVSLQWWECGTSPVAELYNI